MAAEEEEEVPPPPEPVGPLPDEELEGRQMLYEAIFASTTADVAKMASINERRENELQDKSLTYSELDISVLHQVLNTLKTSYGPLFAQKGLFVDLGSGTGKACIAAALLHPFEKVIGIETVQCLSDLANTALTAYNERQPTEEGLPRNPEVQLIKGDFVADFEALLDPLAEQIVVCLAVATCYGPDQLQAMANLANKMPDGSLFVTFGQGLPETVLFSKNNSPLYRRSVAVKKALAQRGLDPRGVEIEEPTTYQPEGWVQVHTEEFAVVYGNTRCFIFKKLLPPQEVDVAEEGEVEGEEVQEG